MFLIKTYLWFKYDYYEEEFKKMQKRRHYYNYEHKLNILHVLVSQRSTLEEFHESYIISTVLYYMK